MPRRIFCSYSHYNDDVLKRLLVFLRPMAAAAGCELWHDGHIEAGQDWDNEIQRNLRAADVMIMLLSPDYLDSWYCMQKELDNALVRQEAGELRIIPIVAAACEFEYSRVGHLQMILPDGLPLKTDAGISDDRVAKAMSTLRKDVFADPPGDRSRRSPPPIPPVLPHLCDRIPQESVLEDALVRHRDAMPDRPFACIIHGDATERHDGFAERLRFSLSRILAGDTTGLAPPFHRLPWPREFANAPAGERFSSGLAITLGCRRQDVPFRLTRESNPAVVYTELASGDPACDERGIGEWLGYWSAWPPLLGGETLVAILAIKYEARGGAHRARARKVREHLGGIGPEAFPGLGVVVLPELEGVYADDLKHFADLAPVQRFVPLRSSRMDWYEDVDREMNGRAEVSMSVAHDILRTLLTQYVTRSV